MNGVALAIVVGAMLLVRIGWAGARPLAWAGWAAAVSALALLALGDGAWGLAIGMLAGMAAALALLLHAAWTSPATARRPARAASEVRLPSRQRCLGRRFAIFLLVVPAGFAAAQWLAFGAQALARRGGAAEADSIVLAWLLQPLLWGAIMTVQVTRDGPARMICAPAMAAMLGTLLWSAS